MAKQEELDKVYMRTAMLHAGLSKATRKKVGAVLVTSHGVTLSGFNGTPSGLENECEWEVNGELVTKPYTIHAELNAVLKAAKEGVSCVDSTVYCTLSPCMHCAGMLIQAGIKRFVYKDEYSCNEGLTLLRKVGIITTRLIINQGVNCD